MPMEQAVIQAPHSHRFFLSIVIITVMSLFPVWACFFLIIMPLTKPASTNPNAKAPAPQSRGLDSGPVVT